MCSGSFDLLHPGHITHLTSAKKMCDILVVAVARDHFNSKKKGKNRPVYSHNIRAFMISKLRPVDFVILDDGTLDTLNLVKPDIYIKGIDYSSEKNPDIEQQKEIINNIGGKICYTKDEKLSTTDIIKYIKEEVE